MLARLGRQFTALGAEEIRQTLEEHQEFPGKQVTVLDREAKRKLRVPSVPYFSFQVCPLDELSRVDRVRGKGTQGTRTLTPILL